MPLGRSACPTPAEFLDQITERRSISYTEAVRRALALYKLLDRDPGLIIGLLSLFAEKICRRLHPR